MKLSIKKQIVALGGGGFSMEPENPLLDLYVLGLASKKTPKVCFIPTASADSSEYTVNFYRSYSQFDCQTTHLSLFKPPTADIESFVMDQDVFVVGGGNTKNLIALWREWKLDQFLFKAYNAGKILSGISAGALCWFESGITDSIPGDLTPLNCLGFISGSHSPHYDGEEKRRPRYHYWIEQKKIPGGIAADDGAALHFIDGKLHKVVSSRKKAKGYKVELEGKKIVETILPTTFLGR
ncbi:MAG: Type 1 glutamine amidotransferase-like domain-containing protein [Proteobacteria bacterium]|nr:Type 1 glutamine amidotransferase-like domain-containing protein [Pseudomonadota bacterium]